MNTKNNAEKDHSVLYSGNFLTMTEHSPTAEAMLVVNGRISAIGDLHDVMAVSGDGVSHKVLGEGWIMPGLIEPHGHPATAAMLLNNRVLDIRSATVPTATEVWNKIQDALASNPLGVLANGWDPLIQRGLTVPSRKELDGLAGQVPLVILHNSGHAAYFNSAAALLAAIDKDTPNPEGASYGRTAGGELTGVAFEGGAIRPLTMALRKLLGVNLKSTFAAHILDLNSRGITTVADLGWDHSNTAGLHEIEREGKLTLRLKIYELSRPGGSPTPAEQIDTSLIHQVGVKTWADGSPWVGNISASFPYLDTETTRALGLAPFHRAPSNYSLDELVDRSDAYAAAGRQLACHAHGDLAIDLTLDAFELLIKRYELKDHRFRLEHVGAMTPLQFRRAFAMGVTVSVFIDQIYYWGDALVDDLLGPEKGNIWADAGAAFAAGHRATFHNDGWVTPNRPFHSMSTALLQKTRSGRTLDGRTKVKRVDALQAHTANAAWQLFAENEIGTLEEGHHADFIVIDRDPLTCSIEDLADTQILATYFEGVRVFTR